MADGWNFSSAISTKNTRIPLLRQSFFFKQETGKTIIEYLNDIRIDTAKMLLMTTTKSVEEIAYAVGYESPKYFARIFKSVVGISPSAFC